MPRSVFLALILTSISVVSPQQASDKRGKDISVCKSSSFVGPAPSKPVLPSTYIARIECNIVDKTYTTDVHEYYDQTLDAGSVHQLDGGIEVWGVYDYKANELLVISSKSGKGVNRKGATDLQCEVDNLSSDPQNFIFGYRPSTNGSGMIFSANGALRFGGSAKESYIGKSVKRGINVDGWRSCLYWDFVDATMNVDWYFTASSWNASIGSGERVPVRAHVYGKVYDTRTKARPFEHYYDFADFRSTFYSLTEFEVPKGTYCPGRKNLLPLPMPPSYFSFDVETVRPELKSIQWTKEFYDFDSKLVRYDTVPMAYTSNYGNNKQTHIHDFNTGVAYIIDRELGNCTMTKINRVGFDAIIDGAGVTIKDPNQFFSFTKHKYVYEGKRKTRNINCDVWIARRNDWPPGSHNMNTTWEWYFATQQWSDNAGETYVFGQPVQIEVYTERLGFHNIYNLYNYDEEKPDMWDFNILPCFNYTTRKDIQFKLPGKFKSIVLKNEYRFKRAIYQSIANFVNISPIRITNVNIDYGQSDILVVLSMLDKPPIVGDAPTTKQQTPLSVASNFLTTAIQRGEFTIKVPGKSQKDTITLTAIPKSLTAKSVLTITEPLTKNLRPQQKPYTSGHLVAIGLSMLFGCFILACAITFFVYKKRGGSWSSFTPKTFDSEK